MASGKKRSYDLVIGIFISLGFLLLVTAIFLIGRQRRLFETSVEIETHFPNVAGLAVGADVLLSGVLVGNVSAIKFPIIVKDLPGLSRDITVSMKISKRYMEWIREDSVARIDSKGLLGDKIINISIGSAELPAAEKHAMLKSTAPLDFNKALQQAQDILENVTETVADARDIFKGFAVEGGDVALASSAKSLSRIFKEIEKGDGVLHELIYNKKAGTETKNTVAFLQELSSSFKEIGQQIKSGQGLAHALLYDKNGEQAVVHFNKSLKSLAVLLGEVETGAGILHDLIYQKDNGQFIRSLNKAALDLEQITGHVKNGKGSLGLLLKDPSIYNELYGLLGDLNRNRLFKLFLRHGVSHEEREKK